MFLIKAYFIGSGPVPSARSKLGNPRNSCEQFQHLEIEVLNGRTTKVEVVDADHQEDEILKAST